MVDDARSSRRRADEHLAQAGQIIIGEHTMQAVDASLPYRSTRYR